MSPSRSNPVPKSGPDEPNDPPPEQDPTHDVPVYPEGDPPLRPDGGPGRGGGGAR